MGACSRGLERSSLDANSIKPYRDVTGVTTDEINAIEALKAEKKSFSFGTMYSTEAFILSDGRYAGFLSKFCELLSDLFGLPFEQEFHPWSELKSGIDNGTIDFFGELTPTPERKQDYYMTLPIAERPLGVFISGDSNEIVTSADLNGLKIGFYEDTITSASILKAYPSLDFEMAFYKTNLEALEALETRAIDVFICDATESFFIFGGSSFHCRGILPLVYTPVSLASRKPELEPILSVVNKYIVSGGIDVLQNIYQESSREYAKYEFNLMLSDEEKTALADYISRDSGIPVALEPDNYPMCFYNEVEEKFQGIAPDILSELSRLTGMKFTVITEKDTPWNTILEKLNTGEASLVSELLYSEGRKENYLWSEPYAYARCALLSKMDYPYLEIYQVVRSTVGVGRGSAYEELYNLWFPDGGNVKFYDTQADVLNALESGEIDLMLASERALLYLTNYREKFGYKINVFFTTPFEESRFGFNLNEGVLCSIVRKAMGYVDTSRITINWTNRTFDYSQKIAQTRLRYFFISAVCLSALMVILIVLLIITIKTRKQYKDKMITFSTMYKSLPDYIYSKDINGRYTSCNKSFEDFTRLKESELLGKTPFEVYRNDSKLAREFFELDKKAMDKKLQLKVEQWFTFPDSKRVLLETINTPLIKNNKVIGLLGIARDITEHKKAEAAANEASKAKSDFLAKMSHEIRTPMNAIIGMTELALRSEDLYDAQKHILTVKQAGAHLLSIINDILDFTKIEKGKLEIISNNYQFSTLINNVISIIRMRLIDSEVRFVVNIDCNIPDMLIGDETRIRQVMLNILSNAVKYTEKGFISFTVGREIVSEDAINLIIEVLDSGKGIRKEDLGKLFGEYVQIDPGNSSIEGVGLGLAITKNIVKQMDGNIEVNSEYNKGSSFVVTIPQRIHSFEPMAYVKDPENKRIIIYERRELYAHSIISAMENLNLKFILVSNNNNLREELSLNDYDFIFISNTLLEKNRDIIYKLSNDIKIVVLAEFGEAILNRRLNILATPVYSISIANILNGISDNFSYSENNDQIIRFAAPDVRILIVDDINTNLKVAEGLMLPYQMKIDLCNNGKDAIEAVKKINYDLIFMDHKMPEMDGIKTTELIRSINDQNNYFKNVPIIALTANAVLGTKEMFFKKGFSDFLAKPIDIIELDTILEKWIPTEKKRSNISKMNDLYTKKISDLEAEINIIGVDIKKGIYYSGGTFELYLETLEVFFGDGSKKLEEITNSILNNDLHNYTISLHAMKSALANIGAQELAQKAKLLEEAGEKKNIEYIKKANDEFNNLLKKLLNEVEKNLYLFKKTRQKEIMNVEILQIELKKLKMALDSYDAGSINRIIELLKRKSGTNIISDSINKIADKILIGEYEEASDLVEKLYQEVNNDQ